MKTYIQSEINSIQQQCRAIPSDNGLVLASPLDLPIKETINVRKLICQIVPDYLQYNEFGTSMLNEDTSDNAVIFGYSEFPLASESIDIVLSPHVLELSPQPSLTLAHLRSVMTDDASLVLTGFNALNPLSRKMVRSLHHPIKPNKPLTPRAAKIQLQQCGFKVIAAEYIDYGWWVSESASDKVKQRAYWVGERWFARFGQGFIFVCQKDIATLKPWQKLVSPIKNMVQNRSEVGSYNCQNNIDSRSRKRTL